MSSKNALPFCLWLTLLFTTIGHAQITELQDWLAITPADRPPLESLSFSTMPLSADESALARDLLLADKQARILEAYGPQWDDRLITYGTYEMPFFYQIFGDEPEDGRSLFISLHGGGGVPASVNDGQYQNQQHLYDATMNTLEGVYLAPRAPTNTWNLWHQGHIDEFFNILIQLAVLKENVNPNKIYLMGYSAGGDGVYQLAPRMADRWAAASMMAGHPNETSPLGLRNLPFAIHVGALDNAFNRNGVAEQWGIDLDDLQSEDPQGYIHQVELHAGLGHWMNLQDAVALPWMTNYQRTSIPDKVVWKQDDVHHTSFYWLKTPAGAITTGGEIYAEYDSTANEINIEENYSDTLQFMINDDMLNLDEPVTINLSKTLLYEGMLYRSILNLYESLSAKGDGDLAFPCLVSIVNNEIVIEENVVDVETVNPADPIQVYPVPATDQITVVLPESSGEERTVSISDLQGRVLQVIKTNDQHINIDLSPLTDAVYILRVESEGEILTSKLLKH